MRCLYCYKKLEQGQVDFHPACSRKIFGKPEPPVLPYTEDQMLELGEKIIKSQIAVTGVQPKLSLDLEKPGKENNDIKNTKLGISISNVGGSLHNIKVGDTDILPLTKVLTVSGYENEEFQVKSLDANRAVYYFKNDRDRKSVV